MGESLFKDLIPQKEPESKAAEPEAWCVLELPERQRDRLGQIMGQGWAKCHGAECM